MKRNKWLLPSLISGIGGFIICMILLHSMFYRTGTHGDVNFNEIVGAVSVVMGLFSFGMVALSWKD